MSLEPEDVDKLKLLLASSGWREVMKPSLRKYAADQIKALRLNPAERIEAGGQFKNNTDAELRAGIATVEWWIAAFENKVKVDQMNRARDELERANA